MITPSDLLTHLSPQTLLQYSDLEGQGVQNNAAIDDAISDATAHARAFINPFPDTPGAFLKDIIVQLTILKLRRRNGHRDEALKEEETRLNGYLTKMGKGTIDVEDSTTGTDAAAATPTRIEQRAFVHREGGGFSRTRRC